jgi:hypothetical protein
MQFNMEAVIIWSIFSGYVDEAKNSMDMPGSIGVKHQDPFPLARNS